MDRLNKITFKKYKYKGETYTIGFKIKQDMKYKSIDVYIGVYTSMKVEPYGRIHIFRDIFTGFSDQGIQQALDQIFEYIERGSDFDNVGLATKIKKLLDK
jgi:hypothetical protein